MEIVHIAAECFPVNKIGDLADVVGALAKYHNKTELTTKVVLPFLNSKFVLNNELECIYSDFVKLGNFNFPFYVHSEKNQSLDFELFLIEIPELFDRKELYGYEDDIERFVSFQIAFLNWLNSQKQLPNIIHCHDHHTGLIPFLIQNASKYDRLKKIPTVFSVYNPAFQGQFGFEKLHYLPEFDLSKASHLEWNKQINSTATAIKCATKIVSGSPSSLNEMSKFSFGLESVFYETRNKTIGILNGIDSEIWNPEIDDFIFENYGLETIENGKKQNKNLLCNQFNLDPTKPLFAFIGNLAPDNGTDLLPLSIVTALKKKKAEINILVLGKGAFEIENQLTNLVTSFKGNFNFYKENNTNLEHLIFAGSDFLLIPSRKTTNNTNHLIAYQYGTIPVVRRIGDITKTVIDIGDGGCGICHHQSSVEDICDSISRAEALYKNKLLLNEVQKNAMKLDYSWEKISQDYIKLYHLISN